VFPWRVGHKHQQTLMIDEKCQLSRELLLSLLYFSVGRCARIVSTVCGMLPVGSQELTWNYLHALSG
jgi:hypothetical protein